MVLVFPISNFFINKNSQGRKSVCENKYVPSSANSALLKTDTHKGYENAFVFNVTFLEFVLKLKVELQSGCHTCYVVVVGRIVVVVIAVVAKVVVVLI